MRVLLTNGHGFVGSHLTELLLERGVAVRCLVRRPEVPRFLAERKVEVVRGDVRDAASLTDALRGVDHVYHLAGLTRSMTRRAMFATNAGGTLNLLRAAVETRLPGRFLLCSSLAASGPNADVTLESMPARPITWYGESKVLAERLVAAHANRLAVSIVRPPGVYGPRDGDFLQQFKAVARGIAPVVGDPTARYSLVHAHDLAAGMVAVVESARAEGATYNVAHPEIVTQEDMLAATEAALGCRARRVRVPVSTCRVLGRVTDLVSQLTGRASVLGDQRIRELSTHHWVCSPAALARDTGWRATLDTRQGFAQTALWYREAGWL